MCDAPAPFRELFTKGPYRLVRCARCGLVFQDPQPDEPTLEQAYYHDAEFTQALFGSLRAWTLEQAESKLELLGRVAGPLPPGRALDVGCSSGAWLEVARAHGWETTGIEPGAGTSEAARGRGLDVRTGTLAQIAPTLEPGSFDLITYWDVLEHLRDPRGELALAATLLRAGGVLAATMPNVGGLFPRLSYRLIARWSKVWEYPELPVHLHDFSPATVTRLLERSGLRVVGLRTWPIPYAFYRSTTLSEQALGSRRRRLALLAAFATLRATVYPLAQLLDRSNALIVAAVLPQPQGGRTGAR